MKAALTETEKNGIKFDKDECQKLLHLLNQVWQNLLWTK